MKLALIPQPQKIVYDGGRCRLPLRGIIGITDHRLYPVAGQLRRLIRTCDVNVHVSNLNETISIRLAKQRKAGGYKLRISPKGITLESDSAAAAFWGAQTLLQIAQQCPDNQLPCVRIDDWPDFQDRGIYYDVCRGRIPKLERLMEMADVLAKYKINQLQLYIEHTFAFRGHPAIGRGASPLTAEDILKLDAYCRERYIELVPSLSSFGHLSTVLKHPQYHHLAEDWGKGKYVTPDRKIRQQMDDWLKLYKQFAFTLSPANPKTYSFLDSLFSEFLPLFSSKRFNACCDETYDLGYGQSYKLCQKIGRGRLYLSHIIKLNELSRKYGKQMMFWGDIIRHYPELIPEIPRDVIVLDWGYSYNHNFERIRDFKKTGLASYACPSTSSFVSLFPRLPNAMANIAGFAAAAYKYGAQGLLNTEWGDGGHYNFMEYSWHGFLFGAEQGWNTKADQSNFTNRFCHLFLKTNDLKVEKALTELGDISHLQLASFYQSFWTHIFFAKADAPIFPLAGRGAQVSIKNKICLKSINFGADFGRQTLRRLDKIRAVFAVHKGRPGEDMLKVLPYWVFAVDTLRHAARKLAIMGQSGTNTPAARRALLNEMEELKKRFQRLWLARNRVSEIRIALKAYQKAIQAIRDNSLNVQVQPGRGYSTRIWLSRALPGAGKLKKLKYPVNRKSLGFKKREFGCSKYSDRIFYDLHCDIFNCAPRDVLVFFACPFHCPKPMKLDICLGYDGPVKVWIDSKPAHHDPEGTNPANLDKAIIPLDAVAGEHEALIAMGSNHGKAWGLFFRIRPRARRPGDNKLNSRAGGLPRFLA